jgi:hypothetical protein
MRTLVTLVAMTLAALVMVKTSAVALEDCGGRYSGYPGWAQEAFCRETGGN